MFVWKKKEIEATPERLQELEAFRRDLTSILNDAAPNEASASGLQFGETPGKLKFLCRSTTSSALAQDQPGWRRPSKRTGWNARPSHRQRRLV